MSAGRCRAHPHRHRAGRTGGQRQRPQLDGGHGVQQELVLDGRTAAHAGAHVRGRVGVRRVGEPDANVVAHALGDGRGDGGSGRLAVAAAHQVRIVVDDDATHRLRTGRSGRGGDRRRCVDAAAQRRWMRGRRQQRGGGMADGRWCAGGAVCRWSGGGGGGGGADGGCGGGLDGGVVDVVVVVVRALVGWWQAVGRLAQLDYLIQAATKSEK